jgi:hypothetical protein
MEGSWIEASSCTLCPLEMENDPLAEEFMNGMP